MGRNIWGLHMDRSVGTRPTDEGYLAIGWHQLGDLSLIEPNREAFKQVVRSRLPDAKEGSIPVQAGVLFRFVHEVCENDVVIYPSKVDRMVNIGLVSGPYSYQPELDTAYPNRRSINWVRHIPREEFSQAALYEIGSFISLFRVKGHSEEFLRALNGKDSELKSEKDNQEGEDEADDNVVTQSVSSQAEDTAQDFIIRRLKSSIDAYSFEKFVAHLLHCMGYYARVTTKSADGGVDIIAHKDELGFEPPIIKVQCKQITNPISRPQVQQLIGSVEQGEHALFVTLGSYSRDAREYERSKAHLRLIDGPQLVSLIYSHYETLQPRFQSLIPLKRIYIPSLQDDD